MSSKNLNLDILILTNDNKHKTSAAGLSGLDNP